MRTRSRLIIPGITFLIIGCLLFFISSEVTLQVEVLPFTAMLIAVLVFGIALFLSGFISLVIDRL